ncbi:MAG TPA: pyridoxamine 5'-phosphate oxidase family protein [Ginsengibacter sp.]|nr:pyridoxamine 5'-phosphate oxidase family protein [Ginsengibacter sp.]HRP17056.1 pyridoxamine 5'-phosphate oxidase family protein [Ginsengibacter sp.]HRP44076.1 pyridoxamine 5'-phosphate oxidase family protein [Ginsengibacter sp.]
MFGTLTHTESENLLKENIYGRIGCHAFGKTYIVPISYAYNDGYLYFHTFEGQKVQMMRNNPSVCFQIDILSDMANWKSVIAQGTFEELTGDSRSEGIKVLLDRALPTLVSETVKLTPLWPFPEKKYEDIPGIIFRIKVSEITGRFEESAPVIR